MSVDLQKIYKGILDKLGIKAADLAVLSAEELPEDFDEAEFVAAQAKKIAGVQVALAQKTQEWQDARKAELETAIKKQFAAIQKPVLKRLKAEGFTEEDLKDKSMSELFDAVKAHYEQKAEGAKGDVDERVKALTEELSEWKLKNQESQNLLKAANESIEGIKAESEAKIVAFKSDFQVRQFYAEKAFEGIEWDNASKDAFYRKSLIRDLDDMYLVKPDANKKSGFAILAKDGTPAVSLDGNGLYEEPREAIEALAKQQGLLKMSNGGSSTSTYVSTAIPLGAKAKDGKEFDMSRQKAIADAWK